MADFADPVFADPVLAICRSLPIGPLLDSGHASTPVYLHPRLRAHTFSSVFKLPF